MHRLHDTAMQSVAGSYEVTLRAAQTGHMDSSDLPVLGAQTQPDAEARAQVLATIRRLTSRIFRTDAARQTLALAGGEIAHRSCSVHSSVQRKIAADLTTDCGLIRHVATDRNRWTQAVRI
jgi:hypothetical protein